MVIGEGVERESRTARQWRESQERYRAAQEAVETFERALRLRYGFDGYGTFLGAADRRKIEALRTRRDKIADRIIDFLYEYSPRHRAWGTGVPLHWICSELTFGDAMTAGSLSVTPPLSYGATEAHRREFMAPITRG